jgi:hypothetical protein
MITVAQGEVGLDRGRNKDRENRMVYIYWKVVIN